ncbi:O-antigen polysaccharide polymerase Wzy, partial [Bacillus sp. MM2020_1]|nr:O-antigen polysaccharide polymerase Wzy [Bacillus sp. MM2020_1]
ANYLWSIISWYKLRKEFLSPYTLFITIIYVFTAGQSFLWAFNIYIEPFYDLRNEFSESQIFNALFYTCISLTSFHIGALMVLKISLKNNSIDKIKSRTAEFSIRAIKIVGWILFAVSILPTILVLKAQIVIALTSGYSTIYQLDVATGVNGLADDISLFIIPAMLCLLIGYSSEKSKIKHIIILLIGIYISLYLLIGLRNKAVVMLVAALCIWHYCIKPIRGKRALIGIVLSYFIVAFLNVVSQLRSITDKSINDYYELLIKSLGKSELFINTISGMGWSMFPLIKTMEIVPEHYPYRMGSSYLFSFTTLIPNLGFWDVHPAMKYSDLSTWLTRTIDYPYGTGYSIIAEAYINFAWFGPIMMCLIGTLVGVVFTRVNKFTCKFTPESFVLCMILFAMTVMTARNNFLSTIRAVFYYSLPVYIMILIIKNRMIKNSKKP